MKRAFCMALCLILLCSCRPTETGGKPPEQSGAPEQTGAPAQSGPPSQSEAAPPEPTPPTGLFAEDTAFHDSFNKQFRQDFIYNPDDGCYYISLPGELYQSGMWAAGQYPWDPPEIERFCKVGARTQEVTVLSDSPVSNLVYCDGYVYYFDRVYREYDRAGGGRIMRMRDGVVEEVFSLRENLAEDPAAYYRSFYVEGEYLYLLFERMHTSVWVYSLETRQELPDLRYDTSSSAIQISDGTICSLSVDGLEWREGAGERKQDSVVADLIRQFYRVEGFPSVDSFLYDGLLLAHTNRDLLLIDPDAGTLERIAEEVSGYTVYDGKIYYCAGDTLHEYDIAGKEMHEIISYNEGDGGRGDDYFGYENLRSVRFLNGRCFLYMTGLISYSPVRIAELDMGSKTAVYLTDWFAPRQNRMTSSSFGVNISYAYPNGWCVFNDYGSGGGNLISNLEKRICIQINSIRFWLPTARAITDTEAASKTTTKQGLTLYYSYDESGEVPLSALITEGDANINITVFGDPAAIRENEADVLEILKSIHIHHT